MIKKVEIPDELKGQRGVVTKGMDETLLVFSLDEWRKLDEALDKMDYKKQSVRGVHRFFRAYAQEFASEDTYIDLPDSLRDHINGDEPGEEYTINYTEEGPFNTHCWTYAKKE